MKDKEMLYEQYQQSRALLKRLINTEDKQEINFLKFEITNKLNFICRLKERLLKNG